MTGDRLLRTAVVGAGFIGPHHVDAVRRTGLAEVVVLVDSDPGRAAAMAQRLGVKGSTTDLETVLRDPSIDVVHVCTPNNTHVAFGTAVLESGKHLVLEKPIAVDRAGAERLLMAARRAQRHAATSLTYRGYPMVRRARDLVRGGTLGSIRLIHGGYLQDWLSRPTDYNWRLKANMGGPSRAFADIGTHWFDTVEFVSGILTESVMADLAKFMPTRSMAVRSGSSFETALGETESVAVDTEDTATVLSRFTGGARGAVVVSQVSPGNKNGLTVELAGSDHSLGWAQEDPEQLWLRSRDGTTRLSREPTPSVDTGVPPLPAGHPEGWAEALRDLFRPFYCAIANGEAPPPDGQSDAPYPTLADGARGIALIEAVLDSARTGTWASVSPVEVSPETGARRLGG